MTIGIGVLASNGVVLAADSEIAISGADIKGVDSKLVGAIQEVDGMPTKSLGIAGAGSLGYFQSVRFKVANLISGSLGADAKSDARVLKRLEKFMDTFHSKHVIPYAQSPYPPTLAVLVGTWVDGHGALWATENATVRPAVFGYEAIGAGATYALNLLHGYCEDAPAMSLDSAILLACYVVMQVKATITDCGQDTDILVLSNGRADHVSRDILLSCGRLFERYLNYNKQIFHFITGMRDDVLPNDLVIARNELDKIRQGINATMSSTPQR